MPTLRSLKKTFRHALAASLAASPVMAGCGADAGIQDDPDFVATRCDGDLQAWVSDLRAAPEVDYLELTGNWLRQNSGEACRTATMIEACQAQLNELRAEEDRSGVTDGMFLFRTPHALFSANLRVTRGGEAFTVTSAAELREVFGEIDSPTEAMELAAQAGYDLRCEGGGARPTADGYEVQAYREFGECGPGLDRYLIAVGRDGVMRELDRDRLKDAKSCRGVYPGRRPVGLREQPQAPRLSAAGYLARAATLEAASVIAFCRLGAELAAHGAPPSLIDAALAAARDELRHARVTARLARRWGARVERPRIAPSPLRGLEEIARENASEGCVRETFGALEGRWMALRAGDARVRRAYRHIAADELRHAALSWRVARWIEPRLSAAARARVQAVRSAAIRELGCALREEPSAEIRTLCGVPSAREAAQLFTQLAPVLHGASASEAAT